MQFRFATLLSAFCLCLSPAFAGPQVKLETSKGDILLELDPEKAPISVENFLNYVRAGHYDAVAFHRVIDGFMIQTGGFAMLEDGTLQQKPTGASIQNEAKNGLKNDRGTIAMARTGEPHSASAQFFINVVDNNNLDFPSFDGWGYAVFGKVVEGMEVVDAIAKVPTGTAVLNSRRPDGQIVPGQSKDVPLETVLIRKASIVGEEAVPAELMTEGGEEIDPELAQLMALHPQLKEGLDYLKNNKKNPEVEVTPSGLQVRTIKKGGLFAKKPSRFDEVTVHYTGRLVNGQVFDSSYKRGEPMTFRLDKVIKGWTEGLQMIPKGATAELVIPYELAYGAEGFGNVIPPYSTLIFEIELIKIN